MEPIDEDVVRVAEGIRRYKEMLRQRMCEHIRENSCKQPCPHIVADKLTMGFLEDWYGILQEYQSSPAIFITGAVMAIVSLFNEAILNLSPNQEKREDNAETVGNIIAAGLKGYAKEDPENTDKFMRPVGAMDLSRDN